MAVRAGQIVAIGNLKGGTGKSTLAVNLACAFAAAGRDAALVDADPQGSALAWAARGHLPVPVEPLVAAHLGEIGAWMRGLETLRREHELVILDLPSVVAPALATACLLASLVLVPSAPSGMDAAGTRRMLRHIEAARRERPHRPPRVLVVPSRLVDFDTEFAQLEASLAALGEPVGPPMRLRAAHDRAFRSGRWVGEVAPGSAAHLDVMALADTVLELLEEAAGRRPLEVPAEAPAAPEPTPGEQIARHRQPPREEVIARIETAHRQALRLGARRQPTSWWRRILPGRSGAA